jgi:hypothetical protein
MNREDARKQQQIRRQLPQQRHLVHRLPSAHAGDQPERHDHENGGPKHRKDSHYPVFEERTGTAGASQRAADHVSADAKEQLDPVLGGAEQEECREAL